MQPPRFHVIVLSWGCGVACFHCSVRTGRKRLVAMITLFTLLSGITLRALRGLFMLLKRVQSWADPGSTMNPEKSSLNRRQLLQIGAVAGADLISSSLQRHRKPFGAPARQGNMTCTPTSIRSSPSPFKSSEGANDPWKFKSQKSVKKKR